MHNKFTILKDTFGHDHFRSFQEEVVDSILNHQDVLTILPTGGGKSLCYQLPSLLMDGVTVVISPLIALMQDQIKALNDLNISAQMINSLQSNEHNEQIVQMLLNKQLQFLYVAPERFAQPDFISILKQVQINYFVIDEAHCVSAWGHEFRADYRNLHILKENFPTTCVAAFTATATKKVQEDMSQSLHLNQPQVYRSKTQRTNLIIKSEPRITNGKKQILQFLKAHKGLCGIIYTFTRKEAESTALYLEEKGYKAKAYHAGLSNEIKHEVYHDFVYEKIDIVVATIAFGMGIDKSNIRFVIHTSMPKTLENYYQEIGRAGRDGETSYVYLLYSKADEVKRKIQIEQNQDSTYNETALQKLESMYRYCVSNQCRHKLIASYFDDEIEACSTSCDNCTKEEVEKVDVSIDAQKLLSAVYRTNQRFGSNHIIDILRGSKNQKILEFGHEQLKVYGLGQDKSKNQWSAIIDYLVDIEALYLGEYRVLKLTALGEEILKGKRQVFIDSDKQGLEVIEEDIEEELSEEDKVYEEFKALRRSISTEHEIPAYVIFGDKSLKEIARKLPLTQEEFLDINGVGKVKFEKYGAPFMQLCQKLKPSAEQEEPKAALKKLTKTYLETLAFIQEGKSLEEISHVRDVTINTVLSHLSILFEHEKISKDEKNELLKPLEVPNEIKNWIESGLEIESIKELRKQLYLYEYLSKEKM